MTAHQHHTHPETGEPYCCCGYGYPADMAEWEPTAGLPTWAEINTPIPPCPEWCRRSRPHSHGPAFTRDWYNVP